MTDTLKVLLVIMLFILGVYVGIVGVYMKEKMEHPTGTITDNVTASYGYYEKDNVWNRIRVDEHGHVLCHKE